jgi:hypothetical protein
MRLATVAFSIAVPVANHRWLRPVRRNWSWKLLYWLSQGILIFLCFVTSWRLISGDSGWEGIAVLASIEIFVVALLLSAHDRMRRDEEMADAIARLYREPTYDEWIDEVGEAFAFNEWARRREAELAERLHRPWYLRRAPQLLAALVVVGGGVAATVTRQIGAIILAVLLAGGLLLAGPPNFRVPRVPKEETDNPT